MGTVNRRQLLAGTCLCSAGILIGLTTGQENRPEAPVEDLMREHGVLRRILFVYSEAATRLRGGAARSVPPGALKRSAVLFRSFGEAYHEKMLEEGFIFPGLLERKSELAADIGILIAQHQSGRELTGFIITRGSGGSDSVGKDAGRLAGVMESLVRMYRPHAAREDTVIFPEWKKAMSVRQADDLGAKFQEIERRQLGESGFESALRQVQEIEAEFGLGDLDRFTAR